MRVVYVMSDSMRRDHVSAYAHPPWGEIRTPNLEAFASRAAVFENAYIGSYPTIPNRRDTLLGTGDKGLPFNRWKALDDDELTFPRYLEESGVPSMLITDTRNNVTRSINLYKDFTAWTVNRGQEGDRCWLDENVPLNFSVPAHLVRYTEKIWHQILVNRVGRRVEIDWFAPGTYRIAMEWLEQNYHRKDFFLWVDTFDPHEPWDPPQHYIDMYDPGYEGRIFEAPTYGLRKKMGITDRELQHIRARYAGEVTMVDTWFGRLIDTLDRLGILEDTTVIHTSDHGTCFDGPGDFGLLQKARAVGADGMLMSAGRPVKQPVQCFPLSPNVARIPLMIKLPGMTEQKRIRSIVQPWDITATLFDLYSLPSPDRVIGRSVLPLIEAEREQSRDTAVVGAISKSLAGMAQAMTEKWCYAMWRGTRDPALYDLESDIESSRNLVGEMPQKAEELQGKILSFFEQQNMSEEYIAGYRK